MSRHHERQESARRIQQQQRDKRLLAAGWRGDRLNIELRDALKRALKETRESRPSPPA